MTAAPPLRILVIATAGLARFMPALGVLASLRAFHPAAKITILSAPETAGFAASSPYFDEVWTDDTRGSWDLPRILNLRRRLRGGGFDRVYDLDTGRHSAFLFALMHGFFGQDRAQIAWSGTIPDTALAHTDPQRDAMHLVDRWAAQLKTAGIATTLRPDLSWIARHVKSFTLPFRMADPFVLLALTPGPGPAWSAGRYGDLAVALAAEGQRAVLVGDGSRDIVAAITERCPDAVDLVGKMTLNEMVLLAWAASAAIGPDNGPMHLTAVAGCKSIILYDAASDPTLVGQRGSLMTILRRPRLSDIPVSEVIAALKTALKPARG